MPNRVINKATFTGKSGDTQRLLALIKGADTLFDFNKVIPMPPELDIEACSLSLARAAVQAYLADTSAKKKPSHTFLKEFLGKSRRLSAQEISEFEELHKSTLSTSKFTSLRDLGERYCENLIDYGATDWRTWRSKHWGTRYNASETSVTGNTLTFQTEINHPLPLLRELSRMFPHTDISAEHADEQLGTQSGIRVYRAGNVVSSTVFADFSKEAYEFSAQLWDRRIDELYEYDAELMTYSPKIGGAFNDM